MDFNFSHVFRSLSIPFCIIDVENHLKNFHQAKTYHLDIFGLPYRKEGDSVYLLTESEWNMYGAADQIIGCRKDELTDHIGNFSIIHTFSWLFNGKKWVGFCLHSPDETEEVVGDREAKVVLDFVKACRDKEVYIHYAHDWRYYDFHIMVPLSMPMLLNVVFDNFINIREGD